MAEGDHKNKTFTALTEAGFSLEMVGDDTDWVQGAVVKR